MSTIVIRGKNKRAKKGKAVKVSNVVKDYVNRALDRAIEDKIFVWRDVDVPILPSNSVNFNNTVVPVTPYALFSSIEQGVGAGQRVGNKIKIKRLFVDVLLYYAAQGPNNTVPAPLDIIFWFYTNRQAPTIVVPPDATFLQLGNGSDALTGTLEDVVAPVNNDNWRLIKKKVFKLGFASYQGTTTNQPVTDAGQFFANNDYHLNHIHRFELTNDIVKHLMFEDNQTTPNNRCINMLAQATSSNGGLMGASTVPAFYTYSITTVYEDA